MGLALDETGITQLALLCPRPAATICSLVVRGYTTEVGLYTPWHKHRIYAVGLRVGWTAARPMSSVGRKPFKDSAGYATTSYINI